MSMCQNLVMTRQLSILSKLFYANLSAWLLSKKIHQLAPKCWKYKKPPVKWSMFVSGARLHFARSDVSWPLLTSVDEGPASEASRARGDGS